MQFSPTTLLYAIQHHCHLVFFTPSFPHFLPLDRARVWIGLTDGRSESTFRWLDGTVATWGHWDSNQPNEDSQQNCVMLEIYDKWQDKECSNTYHYVCQSLTCKHTLLYALTALEDVCDLLIYKKGKLKMS